MKPGNAARYAVATLAAAGIAAAIAVVFWPAAKSNRGVTVTVPALSPEAQRGEAAFNADCAACHGQHAAGSENGPPLVHVIYRPNHHADAAFTLAVKQGVRAHHWRFGDIPPQPQVTEDKVASIVRYVRELQKANGITDN